MSNFLKMINGVARGAPVQGTDIGSGAATSTQFLAADGSGNSAFRLLASGDIPNNAANTTGTASNITATSNSTLTTLSALSLPGSQITGNISGNAANVTGIVAVANGGTGLATLTAHDVLIGNGTGNVTLVSPSTAGFVLTSNGISADPSFQAISSGSVTSVAFSDGSSTPIYAVSGSPVTSSGTLTITLDTQSANTVFAGPASGSAAQPTFRSIVSADIPILNQNTTGTAGNVTGIVIVANGGTGLATLTAHDVLIGNGTGNVTLVSPSTAGFVLTSNGASADPSFQSPAAVSPSSITLTDNHILVGNVSNVAADVAMSGDASIVASGALTLATVNSNVGSFGSSTAIPNFTVNGKGLITAAGSSAVVAPAGTLSGTTLNSTVVSSSLTSLGTQAQALDMGSHLINNVTNPVSAQDAATKSYVDSSIAGLTWKGPVQAYATSNVPLTGSTPLVIDGYTVLNGDLLLLAGQTIASQDGEYSVSITGGTYTLTANGLPNAIGDAWLVLNGTVYADSAFVATAVVPAAAFTEFAGPTAYTFTAPLLLTGRTVSITQATTSTNGYLSSTDWNTFNNKLTSSLASADIFVGNGSSIATAVALSGDATLSNTGVLTLASVATAGTTGSSTSIPVVTINAKGLTTSITTAAVVAPAGTLSGTTLNSTVVSSSLTSVGTITTGTWNGTTIDVAHGGTGQTSLTAHDVLVGNGTSGITQITPSTAGFVLTSNGTSADPTFQAPATSGTVTSVALTVPSFLSVSGSPVTSSGTLAVTLATQTANTVFAGPASGAAATPTFRALTVADETIATHAQGTVTTTTTIDWSQSNVFTMTLTSGNTCTVTFSNALSGQAIVVEATNGSAGGTGVITWPTVKWAGGTPPTMTVGTAALDVYTFVYNGSFYVGSVVQNLS